MSDQPVELTVSLQTFASTLTRTDDFVFVKALKHFHGREKHSLKEWQGVLATLKKQPV